jgi:hypothetical protein
MKQLQILTLFIIFLFPKMMQGQLEITNNYYGINSWMPDTINTTFYNGQVQNYWSEIESANPSVIRIGGIAYDKNYPTDYQLIKMIDSIQAIGAEPIVQVPLWAGTETAQNAADIVTLVNVTYNRNVKYFAIGNEPYLSYNASWYGFSTGNYLPYQYAEAVKDFSVAMKNVDADISVIAGELAWYHSWVDSLLTLGGISDITGNDGTHDYVDIFSFHSYPFDSVQTRTQVVNYLSSFETALGALSTKTTAANAFHTRNNDLGFGVTEMNITWRNSQVNNNITGVHNSGFLAGQWWSNIFWIGIEKGAKMLNFWSVVEGGDNSTTDHGFISNSTGILRPTYHQFSMMTKYFVGDYYDASTNQSNVKVGASKNGQEGWAIVVHNYETSTDFPMRLRLDNTSVSGSEALKVNINANLNNELTETITANSTTVLFLSPNGWYKGKMVYDLNAALTGDGFEYEAHNPVRQKKIFAHYLPWYDDGLGGYDRSGWCHDYNLGDGIDECTGTTQKSSVYEPLIGEYSQFDQEVLKYHIRSAIAAHIDGFMVNVNPDANFQWAILNNLCQAALEINECSNHDFKIIMSYDNSTDSDLASITDNFQAVKDSLIGNSAYSSLVFRDDITNKPLLVVWSESNWQNYETAINTVFGVDSIIVIGRNANNYDYRDGMFGWIGDLTNNQSDNITWGESYLNGMIWLPARQDQYGLTNFRNANLIKLGGVWGGFDDRLVPAYWNGGTARFLNRNVVAGKTLELTWDKQINYSPLQLGGDISVDNPWLQLITWNDFPEGTPIEPTRINDDFGFEALEICRNKGAIFKGITAIDSIGMYAAYEIYEAIQDNRLVDADSAATYFCNENYATAYAYAKFGNPVLPVELLAFSGQLVNSKTKLIWEVASFENHANFEIQYSSDALNFETVGTDFKIQPKYEFLHEPKSKHNYYRLKINDLDGHFQYSNVIQTELKSLAETLSIYTTKGTLNIDNQSIGKNNFQLLIYNTLGQKIKTAAIVLNQGRNEFSLDLPKGVYLIILENESERFVKKVFW